MMSKDIKMTDEELAEHNKKVMQRLHDENMHLTDTQTIQKIADKFIDAVRKSGDHFCLHESDWGDVKASLKSLNDKMDAKNARDEKILDELVKAKNENRERIAKLENTWKISTSIILAVIVGSWTVFSWMFDNLKDLIQSIGAIAHK